MRWQTEPDFEGSIMIYYTHQTHKIMLSYMLEVRDEQFFCESECLCRLISTYSAGRHTFLPIFWVYFILFVIKFLQKKAVLKSCFLPEAYLKLIGVCLSNGCCSKKEAEREIIAASNKSNVNHIPCYLMVSIPCYVNCVLSPGP